MSKTLRGIPLNMNYIVKNIKIKFIDKMGLKKFIDKMCLKSD